MPVEFVLCRDGGRTPSHGAVRRQQGRVRLIRAPGVVLVLGRRMLRGRGRVGCAVRVRPVDRNFACVCVAPHQRRLLLRVPRCAVPTDPRHGRPALRVLRGVGV